MRKSKKEDITCLKPHSLVKAEPGFELRMSCSRACTISLYAVESLHEKKGYKQNNVGKLKVVVGNMALKEILTFLFISSDRNREGTEIY